MITFIRKEEKLFSSDKDIAKENIGNIEQAIKHILKIKLNFNESDNEKHRRDIYFSFLKDSVKYSFKSKTNSKGLYRVFEYYVSEYLKKENLRNEFEKEFKNLYGLKGSLSMEDLEEAIDQLGYIMNSKSKQEVNEKCKNLYRQKRK